MPLVLTAPTFEAWPNSRLFFPVESLSETWFFPFLASALETVNSPCPGSVFS